MAILVFYNLNHHYFKCNYSPSVRSIVISHNNEIDKMNRMHIQIITENTRKYSNIYFKRYKEPFKVRLGNLLVSIGTNIKKPSQPVKNKNNWYMWRK